MLDYLQKFVMTWAAFITMVVGIYKIVDSRGESRDKEYGTYWTERKKKLWTGIGLLFLAFICFSILDRLGG